MNKFALLSVRRLGPIVRLGAIPGGFLRFSSLGGTSLEELAAGAVRMEVAVLDDRRGDENEEVLLIAVLALMTESPAQSRDISQNRHLRISFGASVIQHS